MRECARESERAREQKRARARVSERGRDSDPENDARLRREGKDREPRLPKVKSRALFLSLEKRKGKKMGGGRRAGLQLYKN